MVQLVARSHMALCSIQKCPTAQRWWHKSCASALDTVGQPLAGKGPINRAGNAHAPGVHRGASSSKDTILGLVAKDIRKTFGAVHKQC